jgi:hypothetical protein
MPICGTPAAHHVPDRAVHIQAIKLLTEAIHIYRAAGRTR